MGATTRPSPRPVGAAHHALIVIALLLCHADALRTLSAPRASPTAAVPHTPAAKRAASVATVPVMSAAPRLKPTATGPHMPASPRGTPTSTEPDVSAAPRLTQTARGSLMPAGVSQNTLRTVLLPALAALAAFGGPLRAHAEEVGFFESLMQNEQLTGLAVYFGQTLISWSVPAVIAVAIVFSGSREDSEDEMLPPPLAKALGLTKEPKEFLKIEKLNSKLESFDYSLQKATVSKESALRNSMRLNFERKFGAELANLDLTSEQLKKIEKASQRFTKIDDRLAKKLDKKKQALRTLTLTLSQRGEAAEAALAEAGDKAVTVKDIEKELEGVQVGSNESTAVSAKTPAAKANHTKAAAGGDGMMAELKTALAAQQLASQVTKLQDERLTLEAQLFSGLATVLTPEQAYALAEAFKAKDVSGGGETAIEALRSLSSKPLAPTSKKVFVLKFFGDVTASQVGGLRQEITALLRNAHEGDEVLLVLNTGGGTVTGYGLAAAQLTRIKAAGLRLTICVEQVAASGGYMMACVADHLTASPFAVLGSIGVITEIPNVYERLKREGVLFNTITAGKYKRTLTPTKKVQIEDINKQKEDIEQVLKLFKGFVKQNRPTLDIDKVATGETWFGPDALEQGLVDELVTSDEVILRHVEEGAEVLGVSYSDQKSPLALAGAASDLDTAGGLGGWRGLLLGLAAKLLLGERRQVRVPDDLLLRDGTMAEEEGAAWGARARPSYERIKLTRPSGEPEPMVRWDDRAAPDRLEVSRAKRESEAYDDTWGWW